MCIVCDHESKDISGLDGPKVATEQYIHLSVILEIFENSSNDD